MKQCILALLAVPLVFAEGPAFEVASIKPAGPMDPMALKSGKMRIGMTVDAARVDIGFMSITDLIRTAWKVKSYQVSGPSWINSERYDITAKMADGANKDQVPEMLQALLAERFKLATHKEQKEHSVYALVQMKGGAKLKDAAPEALAPAGPAEGQKGVMVIGQGDAKMSVAPNANGRGATISTAKNGTMKMAMAPEGNMRMEASSMDVAGLTEMLGRFVDRPIVDETGLKGRYEIAIDLSMDDMKAMVRSVGIMGPGMGVGPAPETASDPSGGSVFTALQKMGLKLEPKKEMIDTIVVDHVEKTPTEN